MRKCHSCPWLLGGNFFKPCRAAWFLLAPCISLGTSVVQAPSAWGALAFRALLKSDSTFREKAMAFPARISSATVNREVCWVFAEFYMFCNTPSPKLLIGWLPVTPKTTWLLQCTDTVWLRLGKHHDLAWNNYVTYDLCSFGYVMYMLSLNHIMKLKWLMTWTVVSWMKVLCVSDPTIHQPISKDTNERTNLSLFILPWLTSSLTAMIITMASRGRKINEEPSLFPY